MKAAPGYVIRPARADEVSRLPAIERAAGALFSKQDLGGASADDVQDVATLAAAQREGRLFVAAHDGVPIGFALAAWLGDEPYLLEIDVHPDHGRRGLGAALVAAVVEWARAGSGKSVVLSTFRDVAWNAPFYEKLGFRILAPDELEAEHRALLEREAAHGLPAERRVVMRLDLGSAS